jgi:hypothetical protein
MGRTYKVSLVSLVSLIPTGNDFATHFRLRPSMSVAKPPRHKAIQAIINVFDWYPSHYSPLERKLLRKLDSSLLVFASLSVSDLLICPEHR